MKLAWEPKWVHCNVVSVLPMDLGKKSHNLPLGTNTNVFWERQFKEIDDNKQFNTCWDAYK